MVCCLFPSHCSPLPVPGSASAPCSAPLRTSVRRYCTRNASPTWKWLEEEGQEETHGKFRLHEDPTVTGSLMGVCSLSGHRQTPCASQPFPSPLKAPLPWRGHFCCYKGRSAFRSTQSLVPFTKTLISISIPRTFFS